MTPWGTYLTLEVSSAEPDADPVWVDLTERVLDIGRLLSTWVGRDSELDASEPGGMSVQMLNRDDWLTPGNTSSPYHPWWKQARRFRMREIIGYLGFDLADGYLEIPEVVIRTQDPDDTDSDITLTVTAVDLLGRLQNAARFNSNLSAHIRWAGGSTLVAYWPRNDASLPFISSGSLNIPAVSSVEALNWGDPTASEGVPQITPASVPGPAGEDVLFAQYDMEVQTVGGFFRPARSMMTSAAIPSGAIVLPEGQYLTVVLWVRSSWRASDSESDPLGIRLTTNESGLISLVRQDTTGTWLVETSGSTGLDASFTGPVAPTNRWTMVGIRYSIEPQEIELWVDDTQVVGSLTGATAATTAEVTELFMPIDRFDGSIAHVQVYVGEADAWDFTHFTAQRRVGLYGLERQTTGERIDTILDYAGWPAGRRDIDPGTAVMQPVSLAGKRPLQPLQEAVETEQGRLFAHGGRAVFHDRNRVHNI